MSKQPRLKDYPRKTVSLPPELWEDIDKVRKTFSRTPSEVQVIRVLLREAIDERLKGQRCK